MKKQITLVDISAAKPQEDARSRSRTLYFFWSRSCFLPDIGQRCWLAPNNRRKLHQARPVGVSDRPLKHLSPYPKLSPSSSPHIPATSAASASPSCTTKRTAKSKTSPRFNAHPLPPSGLTVSVPQSATNQGNPCALAYGNSAPPACLPAATVPEQSTQKSGADLTLTKRMEVLYTELFDK